MLLIIFGFRNRLSKIGAGQFFCPHCGQERTYRLMAVKRWFTLFWVPLVPGKVTGYVVRCNVCGTGFSDSVLLQRPPGSVWAPPSGLTGHSQN